MKLQKQKTREVGNKEYHKYTVVLPPELVEKLEWKEGLELEAIASDDRLILKRRKTA